MSSSILQVNYDEVGQIAQTLRAEGEEIASLHAQTRQRMDSLRREWSGVAAQAFQREMNDSLLPATQRVSNALFAAEQALVEIANIIRQADDETVGYFKGLGEADGSSSGADGSAKGGGGSPPRNMQELAKLIQGDSPSPICVYQIGPNEYLVTIKGTELANPNASANWGSAVEAGLGLETEYEREVKRALLNLPDGANVHLAGYSQGGIVAQNLAGDGELIGRVNIKSITTFGSPYSAPEVTGITYQRFAASGDAVPYLEGRDLDAAKLLTPFVGFVPALVGAVVFRHPQTVISGDINPIAAHDAYSNSNDLKGYSLPFNATAWNGAPIATSSGGEPNSPLAVIYQYGANGVVSFAKNTASVFNAAGQFAGNAIQWVASSTQDMFKHAGNFFGNFL